MALSRCYLRKQKRFAFSLHDLKAKDDIVGKCFVGARLRGQAPHELIEKALMRKIPHCSKKIVK